MFPLGSVQLLHIDGFHSYEAVAHDYTTWLPVLADYGIVLFHDIAIQAYGFGVWRWWEEVSSLHPSLEFSHSGGLGILFPKGTDDAIQTLMADWPSLKKTYETASNNN